MICSASRCTRGRDRVAGAPRAPQAEDKGEDREDLPALPRGWKVHRGFLKAADSVYKELDDRQVLQQVLEEYPKYQFVVLGHSLGAAIAVVLSWLLKLQKPQCGERLRCYAYSCPQVFNHVCLRRAFAGLGARLCCTRGAGGDLACMGGGRPLFNGGGFRRSQG